MRSLAVSLSLVGLVLIAGCPREQEDEPDVTPPEVTLTAPLGGEDWSGVQNITWTTVDEYPGVVYIEISTDSGGNWLALASNLTDNGTWAWDTRAHVDSTTYRIRLRACDLAGNWSGFVESADFVVNNPKIYTWTGRIGGGGADRGNAVAADSGSGIYVAGTFESTVDFQADWGTGSDSRTSAGGTDAFVTKFTGSYGWTRVFGGAGTVEIFGAATDVLDNVYLAGRFTGTVDFQADWGTGSDPKTSAGLFDAFVTKINADGSYGWTYRVGGTGDEEFRAVTVGVWGNIYLAGGFEGTVDFRTDWGASDPIASAGLKDAFVTRLLSNGFYHWTRRLGGTADDRAFAVAGDGSAHVYVTGDFASTVDFRAAWGGGSDSKTPAGGRDAYVTRINADSTYGWTRRLGGTGEETGSGVDADNAGNVFATGEFTGTVDFAADFPSGSGSKTSAGAADAYVMRFATDGTYGWTKRLGGSGDDGGTAVQADGAGNAYAVGRFSGTADFRADWGSPADSKTSAGLLDAYLLRFFGDGTYGWTRRWGGTGDDAASAFAADGTGRLFVTGAFQGTVDFEADWGSGSDSKTSAGGDDVYVLRTG
jgi:hypothetical protein